MSRSQLAERANVSVTTVSHAERGRGVMKQTVDALAAVLGDEVRDTVTVASGIRPLRPVKAGEDAVRPVLRARFDRGWSRKEAARQLGVHEDVLMRLEEGHSVQPSNALKVARAYGLDVFELVPDPTKEENGTPVLA